MKITIPLIHLKKIAPKLVPDHYKSNLRDDLMVDITSAEKPTVATVLAVSNYLDMKSKT